MHYQTRGFHVSNDNPFAQPWHTLQPWFPIDLPFEMRTSQRAILDALDVERAPRYAIRDTTGDGRADTFCNIFLWDASRAAGQEVPHWVTAKGEPAKGPGKGNKELDANATVDWLLKNWRQAGRVEATKSAANHFCVAAWRNPTPKGIGHVAWLLEEGTIAQAGKTNFEGGPLVNGFGGALRSTLFFVSPEPALYADPEYLRHWQEAHPQSKE